MVQLIFNLSPPLELEPQHSLSGEVREVINTKDDLCEDTKRSGGSAGLHVTGTAVGTSTNRLLALSPGRGGQMNFSPGTGLEALPDDALCLIMWHSPPRKSTMPPILPSLVVCITARHYSICVYAGEVLARYFNLSQRLREAAKMVSSAASVPPAGLRSKPLFLPPAMTRPSLPRCAWI